MSASTRARERDNIGRRRGGRRDGRRLRVNTPGFSAITRTNHTAQLQFIEDARRLGVTEPQPPLQQGHAGLLLSANDLNTLLDELLLFSGRLREGRRGKRRSAGDSSRTVRR